MLANTFSYSGISSKPGCGPTVKFFVPTPISSPSNEIIRPMVEHLQASNFINWSPTSFTENGSPSLRSELLPGALKRNPSMGNIKMKRRPGANSTIPLALYSRRIVSWNGCFEEVSYHPDSAGYKTPDEASENSSRIFPSPGSSIQDDFQEIELE